jgi:hypothetical protein
MVVLFIFTLQTTADILASAWHFYSQTQIPELNVLRIGFLLRLLIVDTKPFENLLEEVLRKDSSWESRYVDRNLPCHLFLLLSMQI